MSRCAKPSGREVSQSLKLTKNLHVNFVTQRASGRELDTRRVIPARCLYQDYLQEYNRMRELDEQKLHFRFSRLCTSVAGGCMLGLDPLGDNETLKRFNGGPDSSPRWYSRRFWARRPPSSSWRRALKCGWMSNVMLSVYLFSVLTVSPRVYYFYLHDFACLRLSKLREWTALYGADQPVPQHLTTKSRGSPETRPMRELQSELVQQLSYASEILQLEGGNLADFGMIIQCSFMFIVAFAFYVFLVPSIVYRWFTPFDLHIIRDFINFKGEQVRIRRTCEQEVERFIKSSRMFSGSTRAPWLVRTYQSMGFPVALDKQVDAPAPSPDSRPLFVNHSEASHEYVCQRTQWQLALAGEDDTHACHLLVEMLDQGALAPINRSKFWVDRRTKIIFILNAIVLSYLVALDTACVIYARINLRGFVKLSVASFVTEVASYSLVFITAFAISYLGPIFVVSCWDQIKTVHRLVRLVKDCIERNQREFESYKAMRASSAHVFQNNRDRREQQNIELDNMVDRINANYLFILISFKIFMVQLQSFKRVYRVSLPIAIIMSFLMPIFIRLHVPYFSSAIRIDAYLVRWFSFILSLTILLASDLILFPACRFHGQCSRLYRVLSSLMAHISVVRSWDTDLYDQYAVAVLRKELLNPEGFLNQFVISSLGISATYSTWVEFHFWWGLIGLSVIVDSKSLERSFSSLFQDPLRVYSF